MFGAALSPFASLVVSWLAIVGTPVAPATLPLSPDPSLQAQEPAAPAEELEWKKDEGKELFEEGLKALEANELKEAEGKFKDAAKLAKGKKSSRIVKAYRQGTRVLRTYDAQLAAGRKRQALKVIEDALPEFTGHGLEPRLQEIRTTLSREVYHVLEDFERESNRFSEKFGKTWEKDPKFVRQGEQAMKWVTTGQDAELKVKNTPRNLTRYDSVAFWIYFPRKGPGFDLIFKGKGKSKTAVTGTAISNAFFYSQSGFKGWRRIEIPFKRFKEQGEVSWSSIEDFRIQFKGKRTITLYVDDIVLIRKDKKSSS
ncbi:MAG: hypothetical protein AAF488_17440 [Planctomycetota bacterium]